MLSINTDGLYQSLILASSERGLGTDGSSGNSGGVEGGGSANAEGEEGDGGGKLHFSQYVQLDRWNTGGIEL